MTTRIILITLLVLSSLSPVVAQSGLWKVAYVSADGYLKNGELVDGYQQAGYKSVQFDATSLPSGVYYYRLQAGSFVGTNKLALVK